MIKDDSKLSAETKVDNQQMPIDTTSSQHSSKPNVVGCQSILSLEQMGETANKILPLLYGLNKPSIEGILEWVKNSLDKCYYLSNPNDLRKS